MLEIRWHGRAGQGAKTVSQILAVALVDAGKYAQAFPEYGPERTGAPVQAYNRIDGIPIRRRSAVTRPDAVVVLDPSLAAEVDVTAGLGPEGLLVIHADVPEGDLRVGLRYRGRLLRIAGSYGRNTNLALLGALACALGDPPLETLRGAVLETLGAKLPPAELEHALAALEAGYAAAVESVAEPEAAAARPEANAELRVPTRRLRSYQELTPGGVVIADEVVRVRTGGWRAGHKPQADLGRCVNCLLCWVYCPDIAVRLEGVRFLGFDYDVCKGCELCVDACPVGAITMVAEATPLGAFGAREG